MATYKRDPRRRVPTHPGEALKMIIIPATGLSITEIARRLQVSRQALHKILSGDGGITPEMALRLSCLFGNSAEHWMNMQQSYDLWNARDALGTSMKEISKQRCETNSFG